MGTAALAHEPSLFSAAPTDASPDAIAKTGWAIDQVNLGWVNKASGSSP